MAILHPSLPLFVPSRLGEQAEFTIFKQLSQGLSDEFDVYCNVQNASFHHMHATVGEFDAVILSPQGHVLILEIKAGALNAQQGGLSKHYPAQGEATAKDVLKQTKGQFAALLGSLQSAHLHRVKVDHLLVLPQHTVSAGTVSHPRASIVDQTEISDLCHIVQQRLSLHTETLSPDIRQNTQNFLSNTFHLALDSSARIGQTLRTSVALADGLATWVPRIQSATGAYVIQATAGSGKTQLALKLLQTAAQAKQRSAYVCFNRPLADHLQTLCPASAQVSTFHELCVTYYRTAAAALEPAAIDFKHSNVFKIATEKYLENAQHIAPTLDLLIIDEAQDFEPAWVEALIAQLKPSGKIYVMGDADQAIYDKAPFDLDGAVIISSDENFRSPRQVVRSINALQLTRQPILARSPHVGSIPSFHTYANPADGGLKQTQRCVQNLLDQGIALAHITLLSYAGREHSKLLATQALGPWPLRRYAGTFDVNGNPQWTLGTLHAETLHRFKGQAAPVIVLCEIDFEGAPSERDLSKLFVGFTRAQYRLECVLSERAQAALVARLS
jgi:thymidine kinase